MPDVVALAGLAAWLLAIAVGAARLGWQVDARHRLEATALTSHVNSQYDGYTPDVDDRSVHDLSTLGLNWTARWSDSYQTRVSSSRSRDRYDSLPFSFLTATDITSHLFHNEWRLGAQVFTAALERREDELDNSSTTPTISGRHQDALALGYGWNAGAHALQLNARHDKDSEFGNKTTGSAAYAYGFAPGWRATASAGTSFRAPTLFQRFSLYGTPDLKAETARNFETGLRYQSGHDRAGFTLYRNEVKNLIDYVSGPGTCANGVGEFAGCYGNTGRARYTGVTLSGGTRLGAVNLGASLDLMRPKDQETGLRLARRAQTQATLTADTQLASWTLGGEVQHVGSRFNDAANTQRLPAYSLLNLTASTALTPDWKLQVRVDNLSDKAYESVLGYATAGRTFYLGLSWSPR